MSESWCTDLEKGDRVEMRYGPGTVVAVYRTSTKPDAVMVHADVGQAWLCDTGDPDWQRGAGVRRLEQ